MSIGRMVYAGRHAQLHRFVAEAVAFRPASHHAAPRLRVAATLLTCSDAAAALNELGVPQEPDTSYVYVNVHNPRCPLTFDPAQACWTSVAGYERHPVWGINWSGAALICAHLGGRLPQAQEWEAFASNNDAQRTYPWGEAEPTQAMANFGEHFGGPSVVGRFPPTELGLYDLAGNLCEWCQDSFDPGSHAASSLEKITKGGAWSKDARFLRISQRRCKWGRLGTTTIGIRPVWDDG